MACSSRFEYSHANGWTAITPVTSGRDFKRTSCVLVFVLNNTKDCSKSNHCRSTLLSDLKVNNTVVFSNNYSALRINKSVNVLRVSTQIRTQSIYVLQLHNTYSLFIHKGWYTYCAIERCFFIPVFKFTLWAASEKQCKMQAFTQ
jgi:hypothetical protein